MPTGAPSPTGPVAALAGCQRTGQPTRVSSTGSPRRDGSSRAPDRPVHRCGAPYCMPPEGLEWLLTDGVLTDDEVVHLIAVAVEHLGVQEVRFTGGEPLLRRGLEKIVAATARAAYVHG